MASLRRLTAGIAHEIRDPLNFVNNFAGLSVELLDRLKETAAPGFDALDNDARMSRPGEFAEFTVRLPHRHPGEPRCLTGRAAR